MLYMIHHLDVQDRKKVGGEITRIGDFKHDTSFLTKTTHPKDEKKSQSQLNTKNTHGRKKSKMHLLAINCGSSSIKGKLYSIKGKDEDLENVATLSVSGISSNGEKISIKVKWNGGLGKDVDEHGEDGGEVECESMLRRTFLTQDKSLVPLLLDRLTGSGGVDKDDIKYITHRV